MSDDLMSRLDEILSLCQKLNVTASKEKSANLKFTKKEIEKMPIQLKEFFKHNKVTIHVRRKDNGHIELRCQKYGKRITATAPTLASAKERLLFKMRTLPAHKQDKRLRFFAGYSRAWLEAVKRPYVKQSTFKEYKRLLENDIIPAFGDYKTEDIRLLDLQQFINRYTETGRYRSADKLHQLLSSIFDYAVSDFIIDRNPMQRVKKIRYDKENGISLDRTEEKILIDAFNQDPTLYNQAFVFLCYTGLRRSELASAEIADGFVSVVCSKIRLGRREKIRAIPISPMLMKCLDRINLDEIALISPAMLTRHFKRLLPAHHLHDLRHTFITRAQECGIARELVSFWAGHAADSSQTSTVYTHFGQNREFQLKEIDRYNYDL